MLKSHIIPSLTFLISLVVTTACHDELTESVQNEGKTPITLSIGGVASPAVTRAVLTDGNGKTMKNFDKDTRIFMVMKSEKDAASHSGYEYQGDRSPTLYTVCRGDVKINTDAVIFDSFNQKYWDEAHGRSSQLTIWAYAHAIPSNWYECKFEIIDNTWDGKNPLYKYKDYPRNTNNKSFAWENDEIYPAIRNWRASHYADTDNQDQYTVQYQDLLFSNNLSFNDTPEGLTWPDNRLKYDFAEKKFPTGDKSKLKFYHAMSKITIQIKAGDGYNADGSDFQFKNGNVKLTGFNKKGLFNLKMGRFEYIWDTEYATNETDPEHRVIPQIYLKQTNQSKAPDVYYTLEALVIPNINGNNGISDDGSQCVKDNSETRMEFTIDDNTYKISSDALYTALHGKSGATENTSGTIPFEAGKNYIFTFVVSKTKVSHITAQVADWEAVTADELTPSNARITLKLEERGDSITQNAEIYRAVDDAATIRDDHENYAWLKGYTEHSTFNYSTEKLTPEWNWYNNKNYYHFRAIMPTELAVTTDASNGDHVPLTSGTLDGGTYKDVCWGAPMLDKSTNEVSDGFKWTYNKNDGFAVNNSELGGKNQIYHAIGPTEDAIKLILFHSTSQVTFKLSSPVGADQVILGAGASDADKTTLELLNYNANGLLRLGTGKVETSGDKTAQAVIGKIYAGIEHNVLSYGIVPQDLSGMRLRITTPDHNQYIVNLADITVATAPSTSNIANPHTTTNSAGYYKLDSWYPGFHYTYNLSLSKKKIEDITATVVGWESVEATYDNIQIE